MSKSKTGSEHTAPQQSAKTAPVESFAESSSKKQQGAVNQRQHVLMTQWCINHQLVHRQDVQLFRATLDNS